MNVILDAIEENLRQMRVQFEKTLPSFTRDRKQTGDIKEVSVQELIQSFLLDTYQVKKGGIFHEQGQTNEIDCIILAPNHPKLLTPIREIIIAEGVYCAIEIKPDIATLTYKSEFYRSLVQIKSVKAINRKLKLLSTQKDLPDHLHRIPSCIFSKDARPAEDTVAFMLDCINQGKLTTYELPDAIVVIDNYIIFHSTNVGSTIFKDWASDRTAEEDVFLILKTEKSSIAIFLLILFNFPSPIPDITENILLKYLKVGTVDYDVVPIASVLNR
ncbi:DUF6602 domain-containing protein [Persicitalea jodogahamensis]|uniref:DUF6602 domain-containing protein n=1 Tax=Persicitalea jodogahamensis TaxID=402147 RepID=A0A8J3DAK1_9BACT|nr:DUF6602 domain-containing protein [Persicitalea jodogahamensis]GHB69182.1 hypothetical protein GCM10007390_23390 [Persicitalea jodogahamensis]